MASNSDIIVLAVGLVLAAVYLFRDQLFASKPKSTPVALPKASNVGGGDPRDFVEKMKAGVSVLLDGNIATCVRGDVTPQPRLRVCVSLRADVSL